VILDEIVESTRRRVAQLKSECPLAAVQEAARQQDAPRDFAGALGGQGISLIAEVKRASPSKGPLRPDLDASSLARTYRESGAAAVSVLTEPDYFQGGFADLEAARASSELPVLCKDFIIDRYQVWEARAHGADAVLLIAAVLSQQEMLDLQEAARSLGMASLVEVHDQGELEKALDCRPGVVGINNRNLADFSVDLGTTTSLRPLVPPGIPVVSESGIHTRDDVIALQKAGVQAILVGEALVTAADLAARIGELLGRAEVRNR
jgi:indole-3-glycerol phosphate synthase